jgi:hypothetical protein
MMALKHHRRGASSRVPWTRGSAQAAIPARAEGCENMKPRQPFRGWRGYALWKRPGEALSARHTARSASTGESSAGPILRSDPSAYRRSRCFQVAVRWRHIGSGTSCELLHPKRPHHSLKIESHPSIRIAKRFVPWIRVVRRQPPDHASPALQGRKGPIANHKRALMPAILRPQRLPRLRSEPDALLRSGDIRR